MRILILVVTRIMDKDDAIFRKNIFKPKPNFKILQEMIKLRKLKEIKIHEYA